MTCVGFLRFLGALGCSGLIGGSGLSYVSSGWPDIGWQEGRMLLLHCSGWRLLVCFLATMGSSCRVSQMVQLAVLRGVRWNCHCAKWWPGLAVCTPIRWLLDAIS